LTANDNGTNIIFEGDRVISSTAVITVDDGTDTKAYTGATKLFSTKVEATAHTGTSVTLNGTPDVSWGGIRVYYYYSYYSGVPLDYTIPSKAVSAEIFEEFNALFKSEEEFPEGTATNQMTYWNGSVWQATDVSKLAWNAATETMLIDTMSITGGSITDTSGTIDFGNENLDTTGNLTVGQYIGIAADDNLLSLDTDELTVNGDFLVNGQGSFESTVFPVIDIIRDTLTSSGNMFAGAKLERKMTGGTALDGSGIAFFFKTADDAGNSTWSGQFGGALRDVSTGATVGSLIFGAAWDNLDPFAQNHLEIVATSATTGDVCVPSGNFQVEQTVSNINRLKVFTRKAAANDLSGIGFGVHTQTAGLPIYMKSAITHQRKNSWGAGDLVFCVDSNADEAGVAIGDEKMRIAQNGLVTMLNGLNVTGITNLGDGGTTDYSKFETDGTLQFNGAATVWNDIQFEISSGRVPAVNAPTFSVFTTNTKEFQFDVDDYIDLNSEELAHGWKEGTEGEFHLHVALDSGNTSGGNEYAKFTLYIAYVNSSSVWTETSLTQELTIPDGSAALTAFYLDMGNVSFTGLEIGTQVKCRIERIAAE
jgi:hypothetical protein